MINLIFGENLFLIILGLIWLVGATMQDFSRREIDNWWNFSLIFFGMGYRIFVSILNSDYHFALNGLIGFVLFFAIGNLLYYMRLFAGGDAKLIYSLGVILPLSYSWLINFKILGIFILSSLVLGSVYSLIYCFVLILLNPRKFLDEFVKEVKIYKSLIYVSLIFTFVILILSLISHYYVFMLFGLIMLLFPFLFIFGKSVEESCLIKNVSWDKVTEGDWLYKDIKIGNKKIKSDWQGISKKDLILIQKNKKYVWIKYGIPFGISFLLGFIGTLIYILRFL